MRYAYVADDELTRKAISSMRVAKALQAYPKPKIRYRYSTGIWECFGGGDYALGHDAKNAYWTWVGKMDQLHKPPRHATAAERMQMERMLAETLQKRELDS